MHHDRSPSLITLRAQLAAHAFDLAALRLQLLLRKASFNPGQLRIPAGQSGGGRWTDGSDSAVTQVSRTPRGRGRGLQPTPAQAMRLANARAWAQAATRRVLERDPSWKPRPQLTDPDRVEGQIGAHEAIARQAEARLAELDRLAIGGNQGPPLNPPGPRTGTGTPSAQRFDGPAWIDAYRAVNDMPVLGGREATASNEGSVAVAIIDGQPVFGINSRAPAYTDADRAAAMKMRDTLLEKYPDVMHTENVGWMPNDALFHAEATTLLRAAAANGGTLRGRTIEIRVDREMCDRCEVVLPIIGLELGNPTITMVDPMGPRGTIRDGALTK
jgi:hypothetical protein